MLLEIVLLFASSGFAITFQADELVDLIHDCAKLIIIGTILIEYPWMIVGFLIFIWLRELIKTKPIDRVQTKRIVQTRETAASTEYIQQQPAIEAVQIFDYATGESQYAFIQKTDKSLLTQLGVTLKNTVLLEKGRPQDVSTNSKLISHIAPQQKGINQNISIIYEDNSEYMQNQNKPHVSIPFKIGDFDKQMNEIIQAEILSGEYNQTPIIEPQYRFEQALVAILIAATLPLIDQIYFKLMNAILFGIVLHSGIQRKNILTLSHFIYVLIVLFSCTIAYILGYFYQNNNLKQFLIGTLLFSFQNVNQNLSLLVLPIPTILLYIVGL